MSKSTHSSVHGQLEHIFLRYQQVWEADKSPIRVGVKSRQIGWTWATAAEAVLTAASAQGCHVKYTSYKKEFTAEFIETCTWWAHLFNLACTVEPASASFVSDEKDLLTYTLRFPSGYSISGVSSNPSNLRGSKGLVILDEAAHIPEFSEMLKAADAYRMWGGRVILLSTHNGAHHPFHQLVEDIKAGRKGTPAHQALPFPLESTSPLESCHPDAYVIYRSGPYSLHTCDIFRAIQEGLFRRVCQVKDWTWSQEQEHTYVEDLLRGEGADEEYRCIPRTSGDAYLSLALLEKCSMQVPVLRPRWGEDFGVRSEAERECVVEAWCEHELAPLLQRLDPNVAHCLGEDFGRAMDLTVLCPMVILQNLVRKVPFLVELKHVPYEQQKQILFYLLDGSLPERRRGVRRTSANTKGLPRFLGAALDNRGNGNYLAEVAQQRYGERSIERIDATTSWYSEHVPPFKAALEDGMLYIPADLDVRNDLYQITVLDGIPRIPPVRHRSLHHPGERRHADAAIAMLLAHYKSRVSAPPLIHYESANPSTVRRGFSRWTRKGIF